MNEIIFWFTNLEIKNYWFQYTIDYLKNKKVPIKSSKTPTYIQIFNIKIFFKVNARGELDVVGLWNKNQYWVEELFDNNFEAFFFTLIRENLKTLGDKDDGTERNQSI